MKQENKMMRLELQKLKVVTNSEGNSTYNDILTPKSNNNQVMVNLGLMGSTTAGEEEDEY